MFPPNTVAEKASCLCCLLQTTRSPPYLLALFYSHSNPRSDASKFNPSLLGIPPLPSLPTAALPIPRLWGSKSEIRHPPFLFPHPLPPRIPNWVVKERGKEEEEEKQFVDHQEKRRRRRNFKHLDNFPSTSWINTPPCFSKTATWHWDQKVGIIPPPPPPLSSCFSQKARKKKDDGFGSHGASPL